MPKTLLTMSNFKAQLNADLDAVFLNLDEFAELHDIEGKPTMAVVDAPIFVESTAASVGLSECGLLIFAKVEELPRIRPAGESLNVDGREFTIISWREDFGLAEIQLSQQTQG